MSRTKVAEPIKQRVRQAAGNRCGFCLGEQRRILGILEIEHIIPLARGGTDEESNLWLSCSLCNCYKWTQTTALDPETFAVAPIFNPREQAWAEHFCWDESGANILGLTPIGRATVNTLRLNNPIAVEVRKGWVEAGWHPPKL
ncbi:MAG: HNH endonuclease [Acidobacteria bacterium]|nr:HNH endonuclease [Acidobacteriota bacterium]MBI3426103.1 HNH endonuclease [Acidobacteriota bacterium]